MDLSKAFDTIKHELLVAKLHAYGVTGPSLSLSITYLTLFERGGEQNCPASLKLWKCIHVAMKLNQNELIKIIFIVGEVTMSSLKSLYLYKIFSYIVGKRLPNSKR